MALPGQPAVRTTYRSVFAVGQFRLLFVGQLTYVLGGALEILGLSVLVYARSRSAFLSAFAFSIGFAPQFAGGLLFTSLADRLPPRVVMTAGLLIRATPGLLIGLLPAIPVPLMLAVVAGAATTAPVYAAAIASLLPLLLQGDRYVVGRALLSVTSAGGQILAMGIGGALLTIVSARGLLLLAGTAVALSALPRLGLRTPAPRPAPAAGKPGAVGAAGKPGAVGAAGKPGAVGAAGKPGAVGAAGKPGAVGAAGKPGATGRGMRGTVRATFTGNSQLLRDARVRGLMLAQWLPPCAGVAAESLIVSYNGSAGRPAAAAGPLLAAVPAGMLIGDAVVGRLCLPRTRERLALPLAMLIGAPLLLFLVRLPLFAAAGVLAVSGFGYSYQLGVQQAFLDSVPASLRGRAFGLQSTGLMGGQGLSPSAAGCVAGLLGPAHAMAAAGAVTVAVALALRGALTPRPASAAPRVCRGPAGRGTLAAALPDAALPDVASPDRAVPRHPAEPTTARPARAGRGSLSI